MMNTIQAHSAPRRRCGRGPVVDRDAVWPSFRVKVFAATIRSSPSSLPPLRTTLQPRVGADRDGHHGHHAHRHGEPEPDVVEDVTADLVADLERDEGNEPG